MSLMLITRLRNNRFIKGSAVGLALTMVFELASPSVALALTSGPSTPEVQSFEPVNTTEMVDLFTGDFNYNIPLFEIPGPNGGYPLNIAYHAGIGMDQEASWVGLGWNINVGNINRDVRGMADDFDGDAVITKNDRKDAVSFGLGLGANYEVIGADPTEPSTNFSFTLYYNNYKGVGYSLSAGYGKGVKNGFTGLGGSITLDSQEGINASVNASLSKATDGYNKGYTFGLGYGSKRGLEMFSGYSASKGVSSKNTVTDLNSGGSYTSYTHLSTSIGGGSSFSFSEHSYSPLITNPTQATSLSLVAKTGVETGGLYVNSSYSMFYSVEGLKHKNKDVSHSAYGYEHLQSATTDNKDVIRDFQREKDGMIYESSPNLAIPSLTYDTYSILGQGIGGMYRPYRNDIGVLHDPYAYSLSVGGSFGFEFGAGTGVHTGLPAIVSFGSSVSSKWEDNNNWSSYYDFVDGDVSNSMYEPVYFKAHGEHTSFNTDEMERIGGNRPVAAYMEKINNGTPNVGYVPQSQKFAVSNNSHISNTNYSRWRTNSERISRNSGIIHLTNSEIDDFTGGTYGEAIGEYNLNYYQMPLDGSGNPDFSSLSYTSDPSTSLSRSSLKSHHTGAITTTNNQGMRYVYALPAYNKTKKDVYFSVAGPSSNSCGPTVETNYSGSEIDYNVSGSNKVYSSTTTPEYAYSYMLTSVLGADYVDVDENGPSDDDFGYWVKFDYLKYASNYKWRAPFKGANYDKGISTTAQDNTGSYTYGEKEIWYLARAETKTHIAIFHTSGRKDSYEANSEQNTLASGTIGKFSGAKLDSISLYLKEDFEANGNSATPIQRVHFEYDYSLCKGIDNTSGTAMGGDNGKLTLKKMWITNEGSDRGKLNPYKFYYHDGDNNYNPDYDLDQYDRWGNYNPKSGSDDCENRDFPYVEQYDYNVLNHEDAAQKSAFQSDKDTYSSAWCMDSIVMPTGGTIKIEYESDDYAYVQHREATQMTPVTGVYTGSNYLYDGSFDINNASHRKIYFKLESPIPTTTSDIPQKIFDDYVKGLKYENGVYQLYFKNYVDIRDGFYDYVSGYVELEDYSSGYYGVNTGATATIDGVSCYTVGFVTIKPMKKKNGSNFDYHPMSMAAWQYLRTTNPDLMYAIGGASIDANSDPSKLDKLNRATSLFPLIPALTQLFSNYRGHCHTNNWGKYLDLSKSFIKLCSPDGKKYGGGHRVKKVVLNDNWSSSTTDGSDSEYGQVYDYTTKDDDGNTISSGVAQYEPMIGGDENSLRHAKFYPEAIPFKTDNNLFFEYPVNESNYPGPLVGYSKVTVKSLATDGVIRQDLPGGVSNTGVSGISVNEFYTAKEFPVIVSETEIISKPFKFFVPLIFIGKISTHNLTSSQGYQIELNDMHGKPKSVRNYGINNNGSLIPSEVSSVRYDYLHENILYEGYQVKKLVNDADVIIDDHDYSATVGTSQFNDALTATRTIGVEYEFVTDQRKHRDFSISAGVNLNMDVIGILPIPGVWPQFTMMTSDLRMATTNKIIHRSGIMSATEATDGRSTVRTDNLLYDAQTGRPLLTSVNNDFDNKVYKYEYPSFWEYKETGPAYKNIGMRFSVLSGNISTYATDLYQIDESNVNSAIVAAMQKGDLYIVSSSSESTKATYLGKYGTKLIFHCGDNIASTTLDFYLIRSGARNQLTTSIGNIVALKDPTKDRAYSACINNINYGTVSRSGDSWSVKGAKWADTIALFSIDSVLQYQTVSLNDSWLLDFSDIRSTMFDWWTDYSSINPFKYGEKGIFAPQYSFVYKDDRKQSSGVDLDKDGAMDTVALFSWNKLLLSLCAPNWTLVNQVTKYSPYSYELENKNILNIYSAALYGYYGKLPIAVSGNSRKNEIGFEGFEEYAGASTIDQFSYTTGNIDVYNSYNTSTTYTGYDYYDIQVGYNSTTNPTMVIPRIPAQAGLSGIKVSLLTNAYQFGKSQRDVKTVTGDIINHPTNPNLSIVVLSATIPGIESGVLFVGKVGIPKTIGTTHVRQSSNSISVSDTVAHSGLWSMAVADSAVFGQVRLQLDASKKYSLSAWVSRLQVHTHDFNNDPVNGDAPQIVVNYLNSAGSVIGSSSLSDGFPDGRIIENWQKVTFSFTPVTNTKYIEIVIDPGTTTLYVDDIRIQPFNSALKTYVYDLNNLRVTAVLDDNNYATFYSYDEQGHLFLVKQETAKGVQTVKESRGHFFEQ